VFESAQSNCKISPEKRKGFLMMAKFRLKVDCKSGMTYFPIEIRREGFVGEVEGFPNALTFTLIKPGTSLADAQRSLQIVLEDMRLREEQEENEKGKAQP
jgi:hypothetical protein